MGTCKTHQVTYGKGEECSKCHSEREKARYHANPKKMWAYFLKRNYGMTVEEYEEFETLQGGCCAICGGASTRRLDVDHCHDTGKVRGLLCTSCNNGLGRFKDNPQVLRWAAEYLERS